MKKNKKITVMKKITLLLTMMLVPMMASAAVKVDSLYFDPDASNGVAEVAYHPFLKEGRLGIIKSLIITYGMMCNGRRKSHMSLTIPQR